jgi:integrase
MHLIPPNSTKRKWDIRLRIHDGRTVKIPGDRDRDIARQIAERVLMLVKAKRNGDPPPAVLGPWIDAMDAKLSRRLVELGLLAPRDVQRTRPLDEWLDPWVQVVRGRRPDSRTHANQQRQKVRRIIATMRAAKLDDLEPDAVVETINGFQTKGCKKPTPLATASRRSYGIAIKDFAEWVAGKLRVPSPLARMEVPGQYANPQYERQPLTVKQFRLLTTHLDGFERYPKQKARWTAYDRKLIYWTAVKTGYRETELMKLRRCNLYLDETPGVVCLKARDTKNRTKGEVPIPRDLAVALKKYVVGLEPHERVFPFPLTSGTIVDTLRRDLKGAGIPWELPGGEVIDFHALRSTAITWWLDVDGLSPKRVQVLARLKTLALVQNYSRNLRIEDFGWLDRGPKLVVARRRRRSA